MRVYVFVGVCEGMLNPIPIYFLCREWLPSMFGFWDNVLNEVEKTANVSVSRTGHHRDAASLIRKYLP